MSYVLLHLVLPFVGGVLVLLAAAWLRGSRARRAADRFGAAGSARLAVNAYGDHPYPQVPVPSTLVLAGGSARLESVAGRPVDTVLPAGRIEVVRVRAGRPVDGLLARPDQEPWLVVVARDGAGADLRLAVTEEEVGPVVAVLDSAGLLTGPAAATTRDRERRWGRHLVPGWTVLLGAAAALGLLVVLSTWWASEPVTAVVTGPADEYDYCPVTWADPWDGRTQDAQLSCWDEQPGDVIAGLALGWPFRGEVFDTESFPVLAALPFLLLVVAACGPLWRRYQPAPGHRLWEVAPAWSVLLGLVAGAWTLAAAASWVAAVPVQVTVTGSAGEGWCAVAWEDPRDFEDRTGEVACDDKPAGARLAAVAPDHPFRGWVFDRITFPCLVGAGVLVMGVAAFGPISRRADPSRRRQAQHRSSSGSWEAPPEVAEGVVLEDLTAAAVEPVLRERSRVEGWGPVPPAVEPLSRPEALAAPWWRVPALRGLATTTVVGSLSVLLILPVLLVGSWTSWGGWLGTRGPVDRVPAQLEVVDDGGFPFFPVDAEATFTTSSDREQEAMVAWLGDDTATVTVEHSLADPTRARVVGPGDGTGRGQLLSLLGAVGVVGWLVGAAVLAARRVRRLRRALAAEETGFDYLLTRDDEDDFALLLLDGDRFVWALPLADEAAGGLPLRGRVGLHGELAEDGHVVAVVDDAVWWPGGTLAPADNGLVRFLVTGELEDDEDD